MHFVLRQRASLIRANYIRAPHRFTGLQLPYEILIPQHLLHTVRQRDAHWQRQSFRNGHHHNRHPHDYIPQDFLKVLAGKRPIIDGPLDKPAHHQQKDYYYRGVQSEFTNVHCNSFKFLLQRRDHLNLILKYALNLSLTRAFSHTDYHEESLPLQYLSAWHKHRARQSHCLNPLLVLA